MDLLSKITSNKTALYLTLAAVVVLFPNVFYLAYHVGSDMPMPYLRELQAFLIGIYVSWSIVYFTLKGNVKVSYAFAIFEMLVSFFYYWNRLLFDETGFHMNFWIIPAIMIAVFLPWSVKNYAASVGSDKVDPLARMKGESKKKWKKRVKNITFPTVGDQNELEGIKDARYEAIPQDEQYRVVTKYEENSRKASMDFLAEQINKKAKRIEDLEAALKVYEDQVNQTRAERDTYKNSLVDPEAKKALELTQEQIARFEEEINTLQDDNAYLSDTVEVLQHEKEQLIKEKEWYKDIASKYQNKEEKVSPIFKNTES